MPGWRKHRPWIAGSRPVALWEKFHAATNAAPCPIAPPGNACWPAMPDMRRCWKTMWCCRMAPHSRWAMRTGFRTASISSSWNIMARPARACCCRISGIVGRGFQPGAHAFAPYRGRGLYPLAARRRNCCWRCRRFNLPVDHLLFNPNNSQMFADLKPWQLLPAVARQQDFVGDKSDIEGWRVGLRKFDAHLCEARIDPVRL